MNKKTVFISESQMKEQNNIINEISMRNASAANKIYACVMTFGCLQNEADSEHIKGMLDNMGYDVIHESRAKECGVIIINTCAIREHAELKILSKTGGLKHFKEANPGLVIGMCGCMTEQQHRTDDIKNRYPYVDFVFGTHDLYRFPEIFQNAMQIGKRLFAEPVQRDSVAEGLPSLRANNARALVSIMYGCDNYCSYCVVPYVRGRERSRERFAVIGEIKTLIENGYKDITLLGQNVNSYGKTLYDDYSFAELINDILKIGGDYLIRFMTSHPKDVTDDLISVIASDNRVARHFHLPLQSGSNKVLDRMNRKYSREHYLELTEKIKAGIPDIAITTDIITGFPGETEEDFEDTLDIIRRVEFDNIYSFIYSKRAGTPAATMQDTIDRSVINARFARLIELQNSITLKRNKALEGKTLRVLAESFADGILTGRTSGNKLVRFNGNSGLIGKFCDVRIAAARLHDLSGELI